MPTLSASTRLVQRCSRPTARHPNPLFACVSTICVWNYCKGTARCNSTGLCLTGNTENYGAGQARVRRVNVRPQQKAKRRMLCYRIGPQRQSPASRLLCVPSRLRISSFVADLSPSCCPATLLSTGGPCRWREPATAMSAGAPQTPAACAAYAHNLAALNLPSGT